MVYETMLLNYVQLCHINAFYYGNLYIYCEMPKKFEHHILYLALFAASMKPKVLRTGKEQG